MEYQNDGNIQVYQTAVALFHRGAGSQPDMDSHVIVQVRGRDTQGTEFNIFTEMNLDVAINLRDQLSANIRSH